MQYMKEHHLLHIISTARSWRGINNDSKSRSGGYMLRAVGVERGQHLPSSQPKKHHSENGVSSGDGGERARQVRPSRAGCPKAPHEAEPHIRRVLSAGSDVAPRWHLAMSVDIFVVTESKIDPESVEAKEPAIHNCPTTHRAAPQ